MSEIPNPEMASQVQMISYLAKFKGPRKNEILSPFIVISLLRKIGYKEMNVQKFRNFVITEFVKSGIHCLTKRKSGKFANRVIDLKT